MTQLENENHSDEWFFNTKNKTLGNYSCDCLFLIQKRYKN